MKLKYTIAALAVTTITSNAAVYLIDIDDGSDLDTPSGAAQLDGNFWNQYIAGGAATGVETLQDTLGSTAAGIQIAHTSGTLDGSKNSAAGAKPFIATAGNDFLFTSGTVTAVFTISGLDSTGLTAYTFDLFGSSSRTTAVTAEYTVEGIMPEGTQTQDHALNISDITTFSNVIANGSGEITLELQNATGSSFALLNTMSITSSPVPEPSSTALLGLGGLALILRRRK